MNVRSQLARWDDLDEAFVDMSEEEAAAFQAIWDAFSPRVCPCGHDYRKPARMRRLPHRNAALAGVGVQQSITENA